MTYTSRLVAAKNEDCGISFTISQPDHPSLSSGAGAMPAAASYLDPVGKESWFHLTNFQKNSHISQIFELFRATELRAVFPLICGSILMAGAMSTVTMVPTKWLIDLGTHLISFEFIHDCVLRPLKVL